MKKEILKEFYDKFANRPTSSGWYLDVEDFLSKALDQQQDEIVEMGNKIKFDIIAETNELFYEKNGLKVGQVAGENYNEAIKNYQTKIKTLK